SRPRQRSKNRSIDARNNPGSLSTGVMSLNMMPFFGKSGTSRTAARSLSTVSEPIGANASGLYSNVNQRWLWQTAAANNQLAIVSDLQSRCLQDPGVCGNYAELPTGNANLE